MMKDHAEQVSCFLSGCGKHVPRQKKGDYTLLPLLPLKGYNFFSSNNIFGMKSTEVRIAFNAFLSLECTHLCVLISVLHLSTCIRPLELSVSTSMIF